MSGSVLFSDNQSGPATGVLKFDYFCTEKFGDEVPMRVYYVFVGIIGLCKLTRCYHVIVQSVNTFLLCVSFPAYNSFVYVNESGIWTSETRLQRNFRWKSASLKISPLFCVRLAKRYRLPLCMLFFFCGRSLYVIISIICSRWLYAQECLEMICSIGDYL